MVETGHRAIYDILSTRIRRCVKHLQVCGLYFSRFHLPEIPTFAPSDMGGQRTKPPSHMLTSPSLIGSGTTTPRHDMTKRGAAKRKQTLLSLLDALNELTNDEEAFAKGELHRLLYSCRD